MRHPPEGVLRRLVDDPAAVADTDRDHAAACPACAARLAAVGADAAAVGAALAVDPDPLHPEAVDVDAAWLRLRAGASTGTGPAIASAPGGRGRLRRVLRRPVVAGVGVVAVVAGAGAAAAGDWLPIFRAERIEPVSVTAADLNAVPDLRAYGEVVVDDDPGVHPVPDAATAEAETGLDVPEVAELPRGVSGEPSYQVGDQASATFTFSAEEAADAGARDLPPELDGSRVRLVAGPGVAALWEGTTGPDLLVGRAIAPQALSAGGAPFDVLRDELLAIPGLPADVAASLRTFGSGGSTLPVPVPRGRVTTTSTEVDGAPATVIATRDRSLAAVAWVADGVVTVVAGPLDADEVLAVARGLR